MTLTLFGGWLGSGAEEGRAKQRNCFGEVQGPFDPKIAEWDLLDSYLVRKDREPPELKHLSKGRKRNQ